MTDDDRREGNLALFAVAFFLIIGLAIFSDVFEIDRYKKFVQDCPGDVIDYQQGKTGRDSLVCRKGQQTVSCDPIRTVTNRIGNGLTWGKVCSANQRVYEAK